MFRNALDQPDLRSKSMATALSAQEIKLVLDTFLFNNRNVETMLDRDVVPLLFSFIAKGKVTEKEKAFKSLLVISSKSSRGKGQIISHLRANYGKPGIQEAAKRLGLEQKSPKRHKVTSYFTHFWKCLTAKLSEKITFFNTASQGLAPGMNICDTLTRFLPTPHTVKSPLDMVCHKLVCNYFNCMFVGDV